LTISGYTQGKFILFFTQRIGKSTNLKDRLLLSMRSWPPKPTSRGSGTVWPQGCTRVKQYEFFSISVTCDLTLLIFVDWMQSNCSTMFWTAFSAYLSCQWACKAAFDVFVFGIIVSNIMKAFHFWRIIMPQQTNETMWFRKSNLNRPWKLKETKVFSKCQTRHFICAGTLVG